VKADLDGHDGESSEMGWVSSPSRHMQSIRARRGDRQNENRSHTNFQQIIQNSKQLIQNFKQNIQNLAIFTKR
jgi:hypothetical protein